MGAAERHPIILRGYIEQVKEDEWFGICLNLNIPVTGGSLEEAHQKLMSHTQSYLDDVCEEGDFASMVPRRAPFSFYARYYWLRCLSIFNRPRGDWELFSRSATPPLALNA